MAHANVSLATTIRSETRPEMSTVCPVKTTSAKTARSQPVSATSAMGQTETPQTNALVPRSVSMMPSTSATNSLGTVRPAAMRGVLFVHPCPRRTAIYATEPTEVVQAAAALRSGSMTHISQETSRVMTVSHARTKSV